MTLIKRLKAFLIWSLYFVCSTDVYLRLNGHDPKKIGRKFNKLAEKLLQEQKKNK